jgi:hypothetical protein
MNRRTVLTGAVSVLPFLAGCTGGPASGPSNDSTSRGSPTPSPRPTASSTAEATETSASETTETVETSTDTAEPTADDIRKTAAPDTTEPAPSEGPGTSARATRGCPGGFILELRPFDPAEHATVVLDDERRAIVAEAIEDGGTKLVSYGETPLEDEVFVADNGAFYEIDHAIETTVVSAYRMNVEWERGQEAPADAPIVEFADLSEADRTALRLAVCGGEPGHIDVSASSDERCLPTEGLSVGDFPVPYPDGGDGSRLVGSGVTWVAWEGSVLRVELGVSTETERRTHSYTAERVAGSTAAFREVLASRYRVRLTELPRDERAIVERAVRKQYEGCEAIPSALPTLRDRLPEEKRLPSPSSDEWYVRFDGNDYLLTLLQWTA